MLDFSSFPVQLVNRLVSTSFSSNNSFSICPAFGGVISKSRNYIPVYSNHFKKDKEYNENNFCGMYNF